MASRLQKIFLFPTEGNEYCFGLTLVGCRGGAADCIRYSLRCKSNAPRRIVNNTQNFTKMTHISQLADRFDYAPYSEMKEYQVEVVTFDDEHETVTVEAASAEEASSIAAEMVGNADYTMVYSF